MSNKRNEEIIKEVNNKILCSDTLTDEQRKAINELLAAYESATYKEHEDRHGFYRCMVDDMVNDCGFKSEELAKCMANNHPTLQQSYMRHCMKFIELMSKKEYVDGRNAAAVNLAKTIMNHVEGDVYLPMI